MNSISGDSAHARAGTIPGLPARDLAVALVLAVLHERRTLDDALAGTLASGPSPALAGRDRAFGRLIATTVLRRSGEIEAVLAAFLERPLPARPSLLQAIILVGMAQLLFLETPAHAAVNMAVEQCRRGPGTRRFDKLVNAVLRRVDREGRRVLAGLDSVRLDIPEWLLANWEAAYGPDVARRIAETSLNEAALDLTVKSDAAGWAARLGGVMLPTGSVRLAPGGRVADLPGYEDGAWWVQDAAAALPARLFGDVRGLAVADLCAAPGGKTAQLAAAGGHVTAVDSSTARLERIRANLRRLGLVASIIEADATAWAPGHTFDAVLLDAPCTATGTIRRHPDILHLRRPSDARQASRTQERLLENAGRLVKPGGQLVYSVCSLEPEECTLQVARFLERNPGFTRCPAPPAGIGAEPGWFNGAGDLRTLPSHLRRESAVLSGLDGFYAARLRRAEV